LHLTHCPRFARSTHGQVSRFGIFRACLRRTRGARLLSSWVLGRRWAREPRMIDHRAMTVTIWAALLFAADGASAGSGGFGNAHLTRIPLFHPFHRHPRTNWAGYASWDGTYEPGYDLVPGAPGLTATYPSALVPSTVRPPCHWETQTYSVPAEPVGERKVSVTRCVSAAALASEGVVDQNTISSSVP
jgi:hypothetical protein